MIFRVAMPEHVSEGMQLRVHAVFFVRPIRRPRPPPFHTQARNLTVRLWMDRVDHDGALSALSAAIPHRPSERAHRLQR